MKKFNLKIEVEANDTDQLGEALRIINNHIMQGQTKMSLIKSNGDCYGTFTVKENVVDSK